MSRLTLLLVALALFQSTLVLAQMPAPVAPTCVIDTPQQALTQGKEYVVTFKNCQGTGPIELRQGDPTNLSTFKKQACGPSTNLASGSCVFKPDFSGTYSMSTKDPSGETFTGMFKIDPAPTPAAKAPVPAAVAPKTPAVATAKAPAAAPKLMASKKPEVLSQVPHAPTHQGSNSAATKIKQFQVVPASPATPMKAPKATPRPAGSKRSLYDMTNFGLL